MVERHRDIWRQQQHRYQGEVEPQVASIPRELEAKVSLEVWLMEEIQEEDRRTPPVLLNRDFCRRER